MKKSGAEILIESLRHEGVDTVFGYPGGAVLNIYDTLMNYSEEVRHLLVRHEQGAVHMADGYARSSGKVGVCIVTSGPGATNTITGSGHGVYGLHPLGRHLRARSPPF